MRSDKTQGTLPSHWRPAVKKIVTGFECYAHRFFLIHFNVGMTWSKNDFSRRERIVEIVSLPMDLAVKSDKSLTTAYFETDPGRQ